MGRPETLENMAKNDQEPVKGRPEILKNVVKSD